MRASALFAVSAIGAMMSLAGSGSGADTGVRMGVWGAAQGIAFGLGGLAGAVGVDLARHADAVHALPGRGREHRQDLAALQVDTTHDLMAGSRPVPVTDGGVPIEALF